MKKKTAAFMLAAVLLLCGGCSSKNNPNAPELLEPVNATRSSYVVEKKDIFNLRTYDGVVVPALSKVQSPKDGTVLEMYAYLGDYVEAGDTLFEYDMTALQESLDTISEQIEHNEKQYTYANSDIEYSIQIAEKELQKLQNTEGSNPVDVLKKTQEIETLRLSLSQQKETQSLEASYLWNEYNEVKESMQNSVVTAPISGNIVYAGNKVYGDRVTAGEILFYISDETSLRIKSTYISSSYASRLEKMEAYIDSGIHSIELEELSQTELTAKALSGENMYSFFSIDSSENVKSGDYACVMLYMGGADDCIAIPNASVFRDDSGNFVYLLDKNNNMTRQNIVTGKSTDLYIEVTEGLSEGDRIYVKD